MDDEGRWAVTARLIDAAPRDGCTVDVTPRRCRKFAPAPGERFVWSNTASDGRTVQSGDVEADEYGLVTLGGVEVSKVGNRIEIARRGS